MTKEKQNLVDTKVSVETAKVLDALAKWSALFESTSDLKFVDGEFEHDFYTPLNEIKSRLDYKLLDSIC